MLNALQKRMNRLALSEALMSMHAGEHRRLVGDDADRPAEDAAEADDDVRRRSRPAPRGSRRGRRRRRSRRACRSPASDSTGTILASSGLGSTLLSGGTRGGSSRLFEGRKLSRRRQIWIASWSSSAMKWITPECAMWASAPPRASAVICSPVTCLMTCGPVMNIWAWRVWMMKSVSAGRVGGAAGAGAADQRDLRHGPGELDVGVEDPAVAGERVDALLDAGPARVVDEDERAAGVQRLLHHVGDLVRVDLAGRAAQDGEVLAGQVDEAAVDRRRAGDDAVGGDLLAGHAEVGLAVLGEQADLLEAAGVDQGVDPLAGGELALLLLLGLPVGPAPLLESALRLRGGRLRQVLHRSACWRLIALSLLGRVAQAG